METANYCLDKNVETYLKPVFPVLHSLPELMRMEERKYGEGLQHMKNAEKYLGKARTLFLQ